MLTNVKDIDPLIQGDYVTNESQNRVFYQWEMIPKIIRVEPELKFYQTNSATATFRTSAAGGGTSTYGSFFSIIRAMDRGQAAFGRIGHCIRIKRVEFAHYDKYVLILDRQPIQSTTQDNCYPTDGDFYNAISATGAKYMRNIYNTQRFSLIAPKELNQNNYRQADPFNTEDMVTVDMDLPVVFSNEYEESEYFVCYNNLFLHTPEASGAKEVFCRVYFTDE